MPNELDGIIGLGKEWEEGLGELISDLKNEVVNSDDDDFKEILGTLEGTHELLSYFKLATRDDVWLAHMCKRSPVVVAGEITPPGYGQEPPVSIEDVEKKASQTQQELEELRSRIKKIEDKIDQPKKKYEYVSKGVGLMKDLFIIFDKVKDYIGS